MLSTTDFIWNSIEYCKKPSPKQRAHMRDNFLLCLFWWAGTRCTAVGFLFRFESGCTYFWPRVPLLPNDSVVWVLCRCDRWKLGTGVILYCFQVKCNYFIISIKSFFNNSKKSNQDNSVHRKINSGAFSFWIFLYNFIYFHFKRFDMAESSAIYI